MTRLLPRVGADPGRLVRHGRIGIDPARPGIGNLESQGVRMRYWLSLFAGLPARSYRPDAARAILDAARPEGCGLRATRDDAQAAISRPRSAAQIGSSSRRHRTTPALPA
jgi:hypothetical protein